MIKQVFFLTLIAGTAIPVAPQHTANLPLEQIVRTLAKNEEEVQKVVQQYTFRRDIRLEELNQSGNAVGEYHAASDIGIRQCRYRREQSLGQPQVTLKRITLTREDFALLSADTMGVRDVLNSSKRSQNSAIFDSEAEQRICFPR